MNRISAGGGFSGGGVPHERGDELWSRLRGIDLYKVQKLLGHRDNKTTQRYAHHYPESLRDGVDALVSADLGNQLAQI